MEQLAIVIRLPVGEVRRLTDLLDSGEHDDWMQVQALRALNFISHSQEYIQRSRRSFEKVEPFLTPFVAIATTFFIYIIVAKTFTWASSIGQVLVGGFVLLIGYHQWIRSECNKNVEDAFTRKAALNDVIKDNITLLLPYVGEVFGEVQASSLDPIEQSSRVIIDMYVFSELDNLEFIFQKAKFGLIYPEFAYRAVKIFIARAENDKFARRASQLVKSGRYNEDFQNLVTELIQIGLYRRELLLSRQRARVNP